MMTSAFSAASIDSCKLVLLPWSSPSVTSTSTLRPKRAFINSLEASNELMKARFGRKVLVLVTDGEDQGSKTNLQESIEAAEKADVIIYSIVLSDPEFYSLMGGTYHGDARVRKLARETGGRAIRVRTIEQIGQAFEQIARELRAQYLLGYSPLNVRHDGSFR